VPVVSEGPMHWIDEAASLDGEGTVTRKLRPDDLCFAMNMACKH